MASLLRRFFRGVLPPVIYKNLPHGPRIKWVGNFNNWDEALKNCSGYSESTIIDRVTQAAIAVRDGKALFERDSVTYTEPEYKYPLVLALALTGSPVNVVDFGGSLGSLYFQHKNLFPEIGSVYWNVLEQEHFVKRGKEIFNEPHLAFHVGITSIPKTKNDILLLASVLPYLPAPWETLENLLKDRDWKYIYIDRTAFSKSQSDRLTIQEVPEVIYSASYPCWFLREKYLQQLLESYNYRKIFDIDGDNYRHPDAYTKGFLYGR